MCRYQQKELHACVIPGSQFCLGVELGFELFDLAERGLLHPLCLCQLPADFRQFALQDILQAHYASILCS